jgi:hypothetical protein
MANEERTFETDTAEANRAREQGLGVGGRELQAQRDPGGTDDEIADEVERLTPDDLHPQRQALAGEHGPKTRAAIRDTVKGSPKHSPR